MLLVFVLFGYVNLRFCALNPPLPSASFFLRLSSSSSSPLSSPFARKIFFNNSGLKSTRSVVSLTSPSSHSKNSSDFVNFTGGRCKLDRNVILISTSTPCSGVENRSRNGAFEISILPNASWPPNVHSTRLIIFPSNVASTASKVTYISPTLLLFVLSLPAMAMTLNPMRASTTPLVP